MNLANAIRDQLERTLTSTRLTGFGERYVGKVRDCYVADGQRIIVVTDRISAFDAILGSIPFKGQVLNQIAQYWFETTALVAPNHLVSVPDPNVMIAQECEPLPVEFVMRSYLAGTTDTSIWRAYERGEREFCGHALADGMVKNQALERAILTPSTKAREGHDVSVSREELVSSGVISARDFDAAAELARSLFAFGQELAATRGLLLVDTKYEFGRAPDGRLLVIDEAHTPDSSRYWYQHDYESRIAEGAEPRSLDKEYVRRWLVTKHAYRGDGPPPPLTDEVRIEAAMRYIEIYELIVGRKFEPNVDEPSARILANLGGAS